MGRELGVFCSVGVFPLPLRATLSHSSKRSYSPLLKRAVVLGNRRVGERRLESSRLVCPGIRFLPINWDWQGLSAAASLALVPAVPWTGSLHRVMFAATRVSPGQEDGDAAGLGGTPSLMAPRVRWHPGLCCSVCGQVRLSASLWNQSVLIHLSSLLAAIPHD